MYVFMCLHVSRCVYVLIYIHVYVCAYTGFPGGSDGKESDRNAGDPSLDLGQEDPLEKGMTNPLQYSCLENSMDRGAWQATVHGVTKSRTQLNDKHTHHTHTSLAIVMTLPFGKPLQCCCLENPMDRGAWRVTVHGVAKSQLSN